MRQKLGSKRMRRRVFHRGHKRGRQETVLRFLKLAKERSERRIEKGKLRVVWFWESFVPSTQGRKGEGFML